VAAQENDATSRSYPARANYAFYSPEITYTTVHEAKYDGKRTAYNHCAALANLGGKFYAFWQGNAKGIEGSLNELWLSTSGDFVRWSDPAAFLTDGRHSETPLPRGQQSVQPGVLAYDDELWCLWLRQRGTKDGERGIYLSVLHTGRKWQHRRILPYEIDTGHARCFVYPSVNPYRFESGRIAMPLLAFESGSKGRSIVIRGEPRNGWWDGRRRWVGVIYTDDGGKTWEQSNWVSASFDGLSLWEPTVCEQSDGRVRLFARVNSWHVKEHLQMPGQVSTLGTGTRRGEALRFREDMQASTVESFSERALITLLRGGRRLMWHRDVYTPVSALNQRQNAALFFSRSGADDFVAGPVFSRPGQTAMYPQGIEHAGDLFVLYSGNERVVRREPHYTSERSILAAKIHPAPQPDRFYIWPRGDRFVRKFSGEPRYTPPRLETRDGRNMIVIEDRGSAGVEADPVYLGKGDELVFSFAFHVERLQAVGNLVLCSFGDKLPVRIGVPSNRPDRLYAQTAYGWQPVGPIVREGWNRVALRFGTREFTVGVDDGQPQSFVIPANGYSPRLYLGDGYTVERETFESNRDSRFLVDLESFRTHVMPAARL